MTNIYNIDGSVLMQVPITKEAKREEELSKSDYISLSFNAAIKVVLPVGSYIEYTYYIDDMRRVTRQFLLLEPYEPTQSDEMSWKYTPEFQHPKMLLGKVPFYIKTKNSQNEDIKQTNWSFVGTPDIIMGKVCDFLNNEVKFGNCGWKAIITGNVKNSLSISFSDNDVLSALTAITNAAGDNCEWHIDYDNEEIYLGNVVIGSIPVLLTVGDNIGVPSISESKEGYYNAYTVFGGTRNITQINSKGENVSAGDIRLQLAPNKGTITVDGKNINYTINEYSTIDLRQNKSIEPLFNKVLNFSDIFPSLNTYVYNVRGREKYVIDSTTNQKVPLTYNADGSVATYKTFTVWYMRLAYCTTRKVEDKTIINTTIDSGITHYWYDFEITDNLLVSGKTLSCSFEPNFNKDALSTPLAGRGTNGEYVGFELSYHKNSTSYHDSDDVSTDRFNILAGDYEIIYQEDNNIIIPTNASDMLVPRGEVLPSIKCNIAVLYNIAMADVYKTEAQHKLLAKAIAEITRLMSDLNNYSFKAYPNIFADKNPRLQIGQRVTYDDGHGYTLSTRILKLSTDIDYDFVQEITIGNQALKGTITQLKEDVQTIIANGGNNNGNGFTVTQINSLIAKYGNKYFLSKTSPDMAQGVITFLRGLSSRERALLGEGAQFGDSFASGPSGMGGRIDGRGIGELEALTLRRWLEVPELRYNRVEVIVGTQWRSPGGGIMESVTPDTDADGNELQKGVAYLKLEEGEIGKIAEDDICMGVWHDTTAANNAAEDGDDSKGNFRFSGFTTIYFRVVEVMSVDGGQNNAFRYVLRGKSDDYPAPRHPKAMMHFVVYGNFKDTTRQSSRYSTLRYERYLDKVDNWTFTEANVMAQFGDLTNLGVFGLDMKGYSAYLNNIYMSGTIKQFDALPMRMEVDNSLGGFLAWGETCTLTCRVMKGWDDVTERVTAWRIERETGDTASDLAWRQKDKARDFRGTIDIAYGEEENDLGGEVSTVFVITADTGEGKAQATVEI